MRIFAVNSESILCKVVCTKTKEVANLAQTIRNKSRSCRLNHNTNRGVLLERYFFAFKFLLYNVYKLKTLFYLVHTCNEREHDFEISVNAGTVQSTKLSFQNIWIFKTKANGTQAHQRVLFFDGWKVNRVDKLITTGVEGTDSNRLITHNLKNALVGFKLSLFTE